MQAAVGIRYHVQVQGITKRYGEGEGAVDALNDVTVGFEQSKFTSIMGASGSGKSTLMQCMAGLDSVTSGHIFLGNTDLTELNDDQVTEIRRDRMGFVFQAFNLLPALSAEQNILLPHRLAGTRVDRSRFDHLVAMLGIGDRLDHRPAELSGGQQQRVAIARALIHSPEIVFCDEPTGALDSRSGEQVLRFLRESVDSLGVTVVMVTHSATAAAWSDRVVFLADGVISGEDAAPTVESVLAVIGGVGGRS